MTAGSRSTTAPREGRSSACFCRSPPKIRARPPPTACRSRANQQGLNEPPRGTSLRRQGATASMTTGTATPAYRPTSAAAPRAVILVVDDDAAMRDYLREELEHEGFRVEVAGSGRTGVERVKRGG